VSLETVHSPLHIAAGKCATLRHANVRSMSIPENVCTGIGLYGICPTQIFLSVVHGIVHRTHFGLNHSFWSITPTLKSVGGGVPV